MGKKFSTGGVLYFAGMLATAAGFVLPIFRASASAFGKNLFSASYNGFKLVGNGNSVMKIMALLVFLGAVAGVILYFMPKIKNVRLFRLAALIVSIAGGLYCFLNTSDIGVKFAAKFLFVGFYLIVAGWIAALVGWVTER